MTRSKPLSYISTFSGIEAASVAWEPLGWEPVAFSEIEPFPCAVLKNHYPDVPNLGDITKIDWSPYVGAADILVGGSPCQSFSIAGNRAGLEGASGLMLEYVRAVRELRPHWFVWENVPGALSSSHGEDFRCLLESMDDLGYGLAWRVLDAQFFGVAQRRRRVFVVGHLGDMRACEVLFESEGLRWDTPSSREKRQALAWRASRGVGGAGGCLTPWDSQSRRLYSQLGPYPTLDVRTGSAGRDSRAVLTQYGRELAGTLMAEGFDSSPCSDRGPNIVTSAFSAGQSAKSGSLGYDEEISPTLRAGESGTNQVPAVYCGANSGANSAVERDISPTLTAHDAKSSSYVLRMRSGKEGGGKCAIVQDDVSGTLATGNDQTIFPSSGSVRRLTPTECERLQGFPDGYTDIPYRGKPHAPDSARYKALGNSMCVPVMAWIGKGIQEVEEGPSDERD
jgi:DNA (cytosine-5)-methyltransferase 1